MDEIKKVMLGHLVEDIEIVIITPLESTFNRLKEKINIELTYNNVFFKNCTFTIDSEYKKGLLILSPQGIASKDIIELFHNTNIIFFGLAGSLNNQLKIGTFVEVKTATNERKANMKLITTEKYQTVKCGYSPCLLGNIAKKYCEMARKQKCDIVDMETACCAEIAIEKENNLISLLLISDLPDRINFWELSDKEQKKLKEGRIMAIDKILEYINFF